LRQFCPFATSGEWDKNEAFAENKTLAVADSIGKMIALTFD